MINIQICTAHVVQMSGIYMLTEIINFLVCVL